MFPRLSYAQRLLALMFFVSFIMVFFNSTTVDLSSPSRRLPYMEQYLQNALRSVNTVQDAQENVDNITGRNGHQKGWDLTTRTPPINPHEFKVLINPSSLCQHKNLTYLVYVHTAPGNFKKRQTIRQTWGAKTLMLKYKMRIVFIMGVVEDSVTMQRVNSESDRYGDIVMEDFQDSYRNLTYKAIAGLKWISSYCTNVTYVIKSDDDILIDMHSLMETMSSKEVKKYGTSRLIMCNQWLKMKVIRDKKSKWYVPEEEFDKEYFPPYCSGSLFIMSIDVVFAMYDMSLYTKFFWVDDFYITGLLVEKLNLEHKRLNDNYMLNARAAVEKFDKDEKRELKFFHVHKLTDIFRMWKRLRSEKNNSCDNCFTWVPPR
ncbi:beta-1,3-galactosyltransferase 1-like [Mya arenaria]|uniref:beta-1,3-galactosyltransferase 1-like n=1 Tax=Mya arenaria TaxID=6604 RepID=UPI0022E3D654|nr:beta-1,3-galactosyltransferase 1-like [Mya arenaria]XP_052779457.1 beta-1,3-galactosyltransferase 1-like [Mya arenaria]XP_052779458.1 beta-1,3-galactosyltransferase 1-like [Mya arenaria]